MQDRLKYVGVHFRKETVPGAFVAKSLGIFMVGFCAGGIPMVWHFLKFGPSGESSIPCVWGHSERPVYDFERLNGIIGRLGDIDNVMWAIHGWGGHIKKCLRRGRLL